MSRVGKLPIPVPAGVDIAIAADAITVKGPKGTITLAQHPAVEVVLEGGMAAVRRRDDSRIARQQHGLRRTLLANAILGVTKGFEKSLEVVGVGYKVNVQGNTVVLSVGYSHPVNYTLPQGIQAKVDGNKIVISGCDKQVVGEVAAQIRRVREPEPYKGKGVKYANEVIRRKAGKSGGKK
ncbi:MAG: ribosomal protein [Desulfomicrobiaceae bacterium]|jgi:large subunit ribosomal protein L6|nr:ribosomal protein [Desulfomicrobiaceae bacterium]